MRLRLSRHPAPRRRLLTLLAGCLTAFVTGVEVGARHGEDPAGARSPQGPGEERPSPVADLTLLQQVGQLVVLRFDGTVVPTYVRDALRAGEAAGAILFGDNVASEAQLRELTGTLQRAARSGALVMADQEGGSIRVVPFAAPEPSPATLARPQAAERLARAAGRDLARLGVNVNLAPVADVASVDGSVMAGRAYPGEAEQVAELVAAAIRGHSEGGTASTAKHFPGLGAATRNTDDAAVTIERPLPQLERIDLVPFRTAVEADVPLVMASHALYPALDERRIASQSPAVLEDLLREELGYEGTVVTDSLEARAVLSRMTTAEAAVRSIAAGADLALTTSSASYDDVVRALTRAARRSPEFRARVEESAGRVLALKERLGLEPPAPADG